MVVFSHVAHGHVTSSHCCLITQHIGAFLKVITR